MRSHATETTVARFGSVGSILSSALRWSTTSSQSRLRWSGKGARSERAKRRSEERRPASERAV